MYICVFVIRIFFSAFTNRMKPVDSNTATSSYAHYTHCHSSCQHTCQTTRQYNQWQNTGAQLTPTFLYDKKEPKWLVRTHSWGKNKDRNIKIRWRTHREPYKHMEKQCLAARRQLSHLSHQWLETTYSGFLKGGIYMGFIWWDMFN